MQKLHFSILINAPKEKVWDAMLNDSTYREWTEVFCPGLHFIGSWSEGADIKFLAPNDKGVISGILNRIKTNKLYEYISIEHLGEVQDGKENTSSEAVKKWAGTFENYTFKETNGITEILVDTDTKEEDIKIFQNIWPKALQKLKEIAESKASIPVTVEVVIEAPIEKVWKSWTEPNQIVKWSYASDDWEAPNAENDLQVGGKFKTVMAAKDKSFSFDFTGVYTNIKEFELIEYDISDGRHVKVQFTKTQDGVRVTETFEIENTHARELQRGGWQAILDNFKKYTENQE